MSRVCELSGKSVMTGNNVSKANNRTRRRFLPNLQKSSMHSSTLGKTLQFRVAASTIRTVEKKGGIDSYLLGSSKSINGRYDVKSAAPPYTDSTVCPHAKSKSPQLESNSCLSPKKILQLVNETSIN